MTLKDIVNLTRGHFAKLYISRILCQFATVISSQTVSLTLWIHYFICMYCLLSLWRI